MTATVVAFSLSDSVTKIGVLVAAAALLGVALMSLLLFAQGRELKRLREWAGGAPERDLEVQQRVAAEISSRVLPQGSSRVLPQGVQTRPTVRVTPLVSRVPGPPATSLASPPATSLAAGDPAPVNAQASPTSPANGPPRPSHPPAPGTAGADSPAVVASPVAPSVAHPPGSPGQAPPVATATAAVAPPPGIPGQAPPVPAATTAGANSAGKAAVAQTPALGPETTAPPGARSEDQAAADQPSATDQPSSTGPPSAADQPASTGPPAATDQPSATDRPAPSSGQAGSPPLVPATAAAMVADGGGAAPAAGAVASSTAAISVARRSVTAPTGPPDKIASLPIAAGGIASSSIADVGPPPGGYRYLTDDRHLSRRNAVIAIAAIAVIAVIVAIVVSLGGSAAKNRASSAGGAKPAGATSTAIVAPAKTTVAVLNSTEVYDLAHRLAARLRTDGYAKALAQAGQPPGAYPATTVEYASGNRSSAQAIARALGVTAVKPLARTLGAMVPSSMVVVVVGADQAGVPADTEEAGQGTG